MIGVQELTYEEASYCTEALYEIGTFEMQKIYNITKDHDDRYIEVTYEYSELLRTTTYPLESTSKFITESDLKKHYPEELL